MLACLCALVLSPQPPKGDRITLRDTTRPLSAEAASKFGIDFPEREEMWLNGKPTGTVIPKATRVWVDAPNRRGRLIGAISQVYGATIHVATLGFTTARGHLEILPIDPVELTESGKILGLTNSPDTLVNPSHGFLWRNGHLTDIGRAKGVRFGKDGAVEGYDRVEKSGEPFTRHVAQVDEIIFVWYRSFTWKRGCRTEGNAIVKEIPWHNPDTGQIIDGPPAGGQ